VVTPFGSFHRNQNPLSEKKDSWEKTSNEGVNPIKTCPVHVVLCFISYASSRREDFLVENEECMVLVGV